MLGKKSNKLRFGAIRRSCRGGRGGGREEAIPIGQEGGDRTVGGGFAKEIVADAFRENLGGRGEKKGKGWR